MAAQAQVLSITELVEHILLYVDWRTLLLAQRVSRGWNEIVSHSLALQTSVGLLPLQKRSIWAMQKNGIGMITSAKRLDPDASRPVADNVIILEHAVPTIAMRLLSNAALGNPLAANFGTEFIFRWRSIPDCFLADGDSGSWRDMQCMQPPVIELEVGTIRYHQDYLMYRRVPGHRCNERLRNPKGVTIGQVINLAKQWRRYARPEVDWTAEHFCLVAVGIISDKSFFTRLARSSPD